MNAKKKVEEPEPRPDGEFNPDAFNIDEYFDDDSLIDYDGNLLELGNFIGEELTPEQDRRQEQEGSHNVTDELHASFAVSYPLGRDVSSYDGVLTSFPYKFGINKITEGTNFVSPGWQARKTAILKAKAVYGTYHFLRHGNGAAQADFFLAIAGMPSDNELPCACDYEHPDVTPTDLVQFTQRYKQRTGVNPIWYANKSTWANIGGYSSGIDRWVARYGASAPGVANTKIWQYQGGPDLNYALVNLATMTVGAKRAQNPVPTGPPGVYPYGPDGRRPMSSKVYVTKTGDTWSWLVAHFFGAANTNPAALKLWHRSHGGNPAYSGYATFGVGARIVLPVSAPGFYTP